MFWVLIRLGGREYLGVLDTGATISIVAENILPRGDLKNIMPTAAICIGDGHAVHNCGDCEIEVSVGSRSIAHRFYVMDAEAFDFVLGTNFFVEHSQILSLTLQAPYVVQVDHGDRGESVPLEQSEHTSSYLKVCKKELSTMMLASKTEDYQLLGNVLEQGLKEFGYSREDLNVSSSPVTSSPSWNSTAAKGKVAATSFIDPLSGWPTGTPGSVNWGRS